MISSVSVYGVAHQDDWQLFMDPNISADLTNPHCKTIVVHVTAGDGGEDEKYWKARERAAVSSLVFRLSNGPPPAVGEQYVRLLDKSIYCVRAGNCALYFLRLPDGGMKGNGFGRYAHASTARLREGGISGITSVDGLNTYHHFDELTALVDALLDREVAESGMARAGSLRMNLPEVDPVLNPNDHNDHLNTALLFQRTGRYASAEKYAFVHYDIQYAGSDLQGEALFWKAGMFSVYHQAVLDLHGHSTLGESPEYGVWAVKKAKFRKIS
ncbi:MAG: PIG-L family deacetylase [Cytophagales bacterium]|nr:PIG-L family deacetylase [Cytophagales bacterium]